MGANFIQMPNDGGGKKVQTWNNTIAGQDVHAEAAVLTDTTGAAIGALTLFGVTPGSVNALPVNSSLFQGTVLIGSGNPLYTQFAAPQHVVVDSGGAINQQYVDGAAESVAGFTGIVALAYNGTSVVGLRADASNNLFVNLHTALPAGTNLIGHVIVDSGGGGGVQYTDGAAEAAGGFTITVAGMYNGVDVVGLRSDISNNLLTKVNAALPAGTNQIGHVVLDSGSTTAVSTLPALPAGSNVIGHVIVDSGTITAVTAITNPLPAGTNVIGHVIVDSGTITAVTAITNALPAGTNVIGHVIVDSGTITTVSTVTAVTAITNALPAGTNSIGTVVTNADGSPSGGTAGTKSLLAGGIYNTSAPTLSDGQQCGLQLDNVGSLKISGNITASNASVGLTGSAIPLSATLLGASDGTNLRDLLVDGSGFLKVNVAAGSAANSAASATGSAVPADAGYTGVNISGNLVGVTGFSLGSSKAAAIAIVDGSGNQITSFGGGTQYTDNTAESAGAFTGTVAFAYNGTDVVGLRTDGSNNLYVNLHTAIPAGTNVIGHVIVDSGTITTVSTVTAVTAITNALPAGTNVIGHVITDSGSVTAATQSGNWTARIVGAGGVTLDAVLGATKPANILQVGGNDGTNSFAIPLASGGGSVVISGTISVTANAAINLAQVNGHTTLEAGQNGSQVVGGAVATNNNVSSATFPLLIAGSDYGDTAKIQSWKVNSSGTGQVDIVDALPAGTNVIGHVIVDSGTITAVTAITNALPAGTNVLGHVIIDSGSTTVVSSLPALPAGTNVIGHIIVDSGTITTVSTVTAVTAITNALPAGTNNIGQVTPIVSGTLTDRSGSVTTGGTSQTLAASNSSRKYLYIENPIDATEVLYVNFTSAASTTAKTSIELASGGSLLMTQSSYISTEAVTVTAVTTGHKWIAKEG